MPRFRFLYRLRGFGRRNSSGSVRRKSLAVGINFGAVAYSYNFDPFWNLALRSKWQFVVSDISGTARPLFGPGAALNSTNYYGSPDGQPVTDRDGVVYKTIKMDPDGRIYPVHSFGANLTTLSLYLPVFIEPGRVPAVPAQGIVANSFILDWHGTATISSFGSGIASATDLGGGKWRIVLKADGTDSNLNIPLSSIGAGGILPTITPEYNPNNYPTSRVLTPEEATRLGQAASIIRGLDIQSINHDKCRGDTYTSYAERDQDGWWTQSYTLLRSQFIQICQEAGTGIHFQFSSRDSLTAVATYAQLLASAAHALPAVKIELDNEPWNAKFEAGFEHGVRGCRLGYDQPARATAPAVNVYGPTADGGAAKAACSPLTIKAGSGANESHPITALATGDLYATAVSGIGSLVLQALSPKTTSSSIPSTYSSTKAYAAGDTAFGQGALAGQNNPEITWVNTVGSTGTAPPKTWINTNTYQPNDLVYWAGQPWINYSGGTSKGSAPASGSSVWRVATATESIWQPTSLSATYGEGWHQVIQASSFTQAGYRWSMSRLRDIKTIVDAAFDAAGQVRPIYTINCQMANGTDGALSSLTSQAYQRMDWDDGHLVVDEISMAPYMGGVTNASGENKWPSFLTTTTVGALTPAKKQAAYAVTSSAADTDAVLAQAVSDMLDPATIGVVVAANIAVFAGQKASFQAYLTARAVAGKVARVGCYECNWKGNFQGDWPEWSAGYNTATHTGNAWSATKAYTSDVALASTFAFDGGASNLNLYRCVTPNTGIRPSTDDGTNWKLLPEGTSGLTRFVDLITRLNNHTGFHDWLKLFLTQFQAEVGSGYVCMYLSHDDMPTTLDAFQPGVGYWGLRSRSDVTSTPGWQACVETNALWAGL